MLHKGTKCKLNISIDDVSPHPESSIKVLDHCDELLRAFPDIKFTLFIPLAYWRTINHATENPLYISEYPEFVDALKRLPKNSFELGIHGYHHGIPYKSNNDEFATISYRDAEEKFKLIYEEINKTGLRFKPIFRPPAWRMSGEAIECSIDQGIKVLCLSPADYAMRSYEGRETTTDVVFMTACPPIIDIMFKPKIELVYHACEWDSNYFSRKKSDELMKSLEWFYNHGGIMSYGFTEDML
jgi:predicted deacetylase